jgi:hypothetical protein
MLLHRVRVPGRELGALLLAPGHCLQPAALPVLPTAACTELNE